MQAGHPLQPSEEALAVSGINDLPDPLLGHIFTLTGLKELVPAALLVCKRWQTLLYGTPALWRQLEVDAPDLPAEAEEAWAAWEASLPLLLSRVANYAAAARLASRSRRGAHWVCSTLRQLQPATITAVSILAYQLPPDLLALEPLCRLTRLTSLQLTSDGAQLPEPIDPLLGLACLLPKLPLHSVHLDARGLPHGILTPLAKLPGLTDLRLVSRAGPLPALQLLTQLAQLRQLWVEDRSSRSAQLHTPLPYPADFQQLERYTFRSLFKNNLRLGPTMLLQGVEFKCKHSCPDAEAPDTPHGSMIVSGARFMRPLEAVGWQPPLATAVPHGKQLRSLTLQACDFLLPGAAAAALAPQQWAQLRALELSDCGGLGGMDDTLQELLTSASQLESLRWARPGVYGEQHGPHQRLLAFPTAIFSHPTLTSAELLSMFDENWDQLQLQLPQPPDPRLEALSMTGFTGVPPTLAAVTSLRDLRFGSMRPGPFHLGKRGLAALQQLSKLTSLVLPPLSDKDRARVEQLRRDSPQLQVVVNRLRGHRTCCED